MAKPNDRPRRAVDSAGAQDAGPGRGREVELKLLVRRADLPRLRRRLDALASARVTRVDSIYFDTPGLSLARQKAALRLRTVAHGASRRWVQTLKTGDEGEALSERGEWEAPAPGGRLDLARLEGAPLARIFPSLAEGAAAPELRERFRTRFTREIRDIEWKGARIEAALDEGEILAGGRSEPILELELELVAGPTRALADLALLLVQSAAGQADLVLLPSGDSKAARGHRLAQGEDVRPQAADLRDAGRRARSIESVEGAVRSILRAGVETVLANARGVSAGADPEFLHQCRVAVRRMRSAFDLAQLRGKDARRVQSELRQWAAQLAPARDWDVLSGEVVPAIAATVPGGTSGWRWRRMAQAAQRRRDLAHEGLRGYLAGAGFALGALRILRWCLADEKKASARAAGRRELRNEARARMRAILRQARKLPTLAEGRRHELRVEIKRLRYSLELLRNAAPGERRRRWLRALSRLQDAVGLATDATLAELHLCELTRSQEVREAIRRWSRERQAAALVDAAQALALVEEKAATPAERAGAAVSAP